MAELKNSTLDDIASVIGFSATIRLAAHYGDRDVNVPSEVSELHPLAKLIGVSSMRRLCAEWAGQRIAVPTLVFANNEIRNAKVLALLLRDIHAPLIASVVGVSIRRVEQIRLEFAKDGLLPNFVAKTYGRNSQANL